MNMKKWLLRNYNETKNKQSEINPIKKLCSFSTTASELTRGGSTGASGKGHVKSASVSSPGPSAVESSNGGQQSDPLGPRYININTNNAFHQTIGELRNEYHDSVCS